MGPFSPARGTRSGFRFHQGRLGTWVVDQPDMSFWRLVDSQGARDITALVRKKWGGGRVLLLPNGFVVKPLQNDSEVGLRALIGRVTGVIVLEKSDGSVFDLSKPGTLSPGNPWLGPTTTGLECTLRTDGSLLCNWYHPTSLGRDEVSEVLLGPDHVLAAGFRAARPGSAVGRVRVTANGHVITNRQEPAGDWVTRYVGRINAALLKDWGVWIGKDRI